MFYVGAFFAYTKLSSWRDAFVLPISTCVSSVTLSYLSLCVRKPTVWVPTRSDTNRAVQSQNMVGGWIIWIQKVEELYYPCSENNGADQLRLSAPLFSPMQIVCFFHVAAHFLKFVSEYPV